MDGGKWECVKGCPSPSCADYGVSLATIGVEYSVCKMRWNILVSGYSQDRAHER